MKNPKPERPDQFILDLYTKMKKQQKKDKKDKQ
jgi:hypothetical protein